MSWIDPAFRDFEIVTSSKRKSSSTKSSTFFSSQSASTSKEIIDLTNESQTSKCKKRSTDIWADKHKPLIQSDLAVHKKKIGEVESWLQEKLSTKMKVPGILLVTGPTGAGKTATLRVLAKELKCEIQEWVNPDVRGNYNSFQENLGNARFSSEYSRVGNTSDSQIAKFQQFLFNAYKYNALNIFGDDVQQKKIILVEDLPNIFGREPSSFHEILRKYSKIGRCPLVFIISDGAKGEFNKNLIFPKDLEQELHVSNISFNPVATTSMIKVLNKVIKTESTQKSSNFHVPSKSVIESISMSSAGDIRGAINTLQFACLKDSSDLEVSQQIKPKRQKRDTKGRSLAKPTADSELAAIGGKDTSIFMFRALGKILYCKRDDPSNHDNLPSLPSHLQEHDRDPLIIKPEDIVERCQISGEYFTAYLHQNYLDFFSEVEDVVRASQYISDSDFLTQEWNSRSTLQQYGASVCTRGLIHANSSRSRFMSSGGGGLGWKPLHKPQWYTVRKQRKENFDVSKCLFKDFSQPIILHTEILPYTALVSASSLQPGKRNFMRQICKYTHFSARSERLEDNVVEVEDTTQSLEEQDTTTMKNKFSLDISTSNIETKVENVEESEEETYSIEEYND